MTDNNHILVPHQVESKLYDYQLEAVKAVDQYIKAYKANKTFMSFLVSMPTGSGKTAIIGSLACCYPTDGWILVLSPRRPVIDQLHSELSGVLFKEKFKALKPIPTRQVTSTSTSSDEIDDISVLCWTIHKLHNVIKKEPKFFELLKEKIKLILFDEGHYEPAFQWSKAVRSFSVPRVIFTATPFRNDFNEFDIDWQNYTYRRTYKKLLEDNILRNVDIENIGVQDNYIDVVTDALKRFEKVKEHITNAKLIMKCDSSDAIIAISKELNRLNKKFVSIHETFNLTFKVANPELASHLYMNVPKNQAKMDEDIWVHQYKLIEGIDNHKFRCLAIVDEMTNTRSLIQQIGRIIRNPDRDDTPAFVFNYTKDNYKEEWAGFIQLDHENAISKTLVDQIFEEVSSKLNPVQYIDRKVRSKLTEDEFNSWNVDDLKENLQIPLKANFLEKRAGYDHDRFIRDYLDHYFKNKQHKYFKNIYGANSGLYLYFNIQNSPYLTKSFFPEITHHICFFKEEEDYLIFYDSGRLLPVGNDDIGLGYGVKSQMLRKIIKETEDTIISRVALKSSNIGSKEPHSHSYIASSINDTAPNLNDFSHFLSSTFGHYLDKKVFKEYKNPKLKEKLFQLPTYIGFATGRVSQSEGKHVKFSEFLDWIDYIATLLSSDSEASEVFTRYSTEISNQTDPTPQCILLDLFDFENTHRIRVGIENTEVNVDEDIYSIPETFQLISLNNKGQYTFNLTINKKHFKVIIKYEPKRGKFLLESPEIEGNVTSEVLSENQRVEGLIKAINRKQCFRILTEKGLSYSGGRFYKPHFKFGHEFEEKSSPIAKMIFSVKELDTRHSEKGIANGPGNDNWQANSLFDLIDKRGEDTELKDHFLETYQEKERLLICTDLGTEPADFIFASNKKLVFIHIKGKGNTNPSKSHYSATAISDICIQAAKNSHFLSIFNLSTPGNLESWSKPWSIGNNYLISE